MKPPAPASRWPEAAHVHVALGVDLGHAEARHVEPAAVVEVELLVLVDHRLGVHRGAEVEPDWGTPPITPGSAVSVTW